MTSGLFAHTFDDAESFAPPCPPCADFASQATLVLQPGFVEHAPEQYLSGRTPRRRPTQDLVYYTPRLRPRLPMWHQAQWG